ncbi:Hypothetical predicted protein [Mytilus galloprovincialis]|uniref:Uncharacterized protein n=1 Tax=Mytilus galloprovincialis TaxID=29158 RepID=A0A8B6HFJ5_MYTGA|nr:Hypothetical predicted protein [Mytilus galloprovincialis]
MRWNTKSDNILYNQLNFDRKNDDIPLTKREVLRQSSRIFDPLGLISPVTVTSKTLYGQRLWKEKLNWDELLPCSLKEEWKSIAMEIEEATKTEISRQKHLNLMMRKTRLNFIYLQTPVNKHMARMPI